MAGVMWAVAGGCNTRVATRCEYGQVLVEGVDCVALRLPNDAAVEIEEARVFSLVLFGP